MLMWLCSTVNSPPCLQINTPITTFDDYYSCASFGYIHSVELITKKFKGKLCGQVFLHYIDKKTKGSTQNLFDKRPHLGLPAWFKKTY